MPVHLGIHSNEHGPAKEAAEIQRSILVAQARRTEGWRGRDLKLETGFHFFFPSSYKSSDLPCTVENVLVTTAKQMYGMWVVWGTNVFNMFSLGLLTH